MADDRFGRKSVGRVLGALALGGALAGAGALLTGGCTDNSGNGKFVEPKKEVDGGAGGATGAAGAAGTDAATGTDGASDGKTETDALASDGNVDHVIEIKPDAAQDAHESDRTGDH